MTNDLVKGSSLPIISIDGIKKFKSNKSYKYILNHLATITSTQVSQRCADFVPPSLESGNVVFVVVDIQNIIVLNSKYSKD